MTGFSESRCSLYTNENIACLGSSSCLQAAAVVGYG
jgi:hypothetical protein